MHCVLNTPCTFIQLELEKKQQQQQQEQEAATSAEPSAVELPPPQAATESTAESTEDSHSERSESAVKEVPMSGDRNRFSRSKSPKARWQGENSGPTDSQSSNETQASNDKPASESQPATESNATKDKGKNKAFLSSQSDSGVTKSQAFSSFIRGHQATDRRRVGQSSGRRGS